jgi:hypothetical protein
MYKGDLIAIHFDLKTLSEDDFRGLQTDARIVLANLFQESDKGVLHSIKVTAGLSLRPVSYADWLQFQASGSVRDMFLLTLHWLLYQESRSRIKRCPECGAIFYRIQKQQYCTRICTNRANVRTWRQREEVKQAEAERAHTRYAKKKSEVGQGARVERRPRKRDTDHAETLREYGRTQCRHTRHASPGAAS